MEPSGTTPSSDSITVDVYSDVICPWCYVGGRKLADGISQFAADGGPGGAVPVEVRWHPFELNPDMPPEGRDRREYRSAKFGSWASSQRLDAQVAAAGAAVGLAFNHELMTRTPNTRPAHRLMWLAGERGAARRTADLLFYSYFSRGLDVGDAQVLATVAAQAGLDGAEAADAVAGAGSVGALAEAGVAEGVARARALGVSGVPFYVFGGRYALPPGAQPADAVAQVLRVVRHQAADDADAARQRVPEGSAVGGAAACSADGHCP